MLKIKKWKWKNRNWEFWLLINRIRFKDEKSKEFKWKNLAKMVNIVVKRQNVTYFKM